MSEEELINAIEEEIKKTNAYLNINEEDYRMGYRKAIYDTTYLFEKLKEENEQLKSQLQQKENIIKEVREYIEDNVMVYAFNDKKFPHWDFNDDNINDILEILDKESKGE